MPAPNKAKHKKVTKAYCKGRNHENHHPLERRDPILVGWDRIAAHLEMSGAGAGRVMETSKESLQWHADKLGFPTFEDQDGETCLCPQDFWDWVMTIKSTDDWWPDGRPKRRSRAKKQQSKNPVPA